MSDFAKTLRATIALITETRVGTPSQSRDGRIDVKVAAVMVKWGLFYGFIAGAVVAGLVVWVVAR